VHSIVGSKVGIVLESPMQQIYLFTPHRLNTEFFAAQLCEALKKNISFLNKRRFTVFFVNAKRFDDFDKKVQEENQRKLVLFDEFGNAEPAFSGPYRCLGQLFYFVRQSCLGPSRFPSPFKGKLV
jgi:hypothetical protein